jgi:hypothetical protein
MPLSTFPLPLSDIIDTKILLRKQAIFIFHKHLTLPPWSGVGTTVVPTLFDSLLGDCVTMSKRLLSQHDGAGGRVTKL